MDAVKFDSNGAEKAGAKFGKSQDPTLAKFEDNHQVGKPDPKYIEAVKAKLSKNLDADDHIGDAGKNMAYKGKSMDASKGGRLEAATDQLTMQMVSKGYKFEVASKVAAKQAVKAGVEKFGPDQMKAWAEKAKVANQVKPQPQPVKTEPAKPATK